MTCRFALPQRLGAWLIATVLLAALVPVAAMAQTVFTLVRGPERLELTLEDLLALPQVEIATENEFADGLVTYRGPLVRDVLELLAMDRVEMVRFTAVNDYFIDVPAEDFRNYEAILALEADGQRLSRRDKGPLWLMYPISDNPELVDPKYVARLIWQVVRAESL